jgi:hypothetical protein
MRPRAFLGGSVQEEMLCLLVFFLFSSAAMVFDKFVVFGGGGFGSPSSQVDYYSLVSTVSTAAEYPTAAGLTHLVAATTTTTSVGNSPSRVRRR